MQFFRLILLTSVVGSFSNVAWTDEVKPSGNETKVAVDEVKTSSDETSSSSGETKEAAEGVKSSSAASDKMTVVSNKVDAGVETIQSALESAYTNNTDLAAAITQLNQANEGVVQAKAGYRPKVTASASVSGNKTINSGDTKQSSLSSSTGKSTSFPVGTGTVQLEQNLYQGGSTTAQLKGAENAVKAARAKVMSVEQNVFFQVVQSHLDILTKMSEIEQYKGNLDLLKKTLEASKDKFNVGEETRTSVAQSESQLAEGLAQLETAKAELDGLRATFQRLTGRMPRQVIKPIISHDLPKTLEQGIQIASQNNPNIIQAKFDAAAAKHKVDSVSGGLMPSLDFKASTSYSDSHNHALNTPSYIETKRRDYATNMSGALTLTIPIYEQGSVRSQKRQAHEIAAEKRIGIETARRQTIESLIQFWENYMAAKANMENFKRQVEANKISLAGTQEEMKVGTKILLDVLNAQKLLLTSQLNLVRAERSFFLESYRILAMMGRLTAKQMKLKVNYYDPKHDYNETKDRI